MTGARAAEMIARGFHMSSIATDQVLLKNAARAELAVAHGEGAAKYGRHNWRAGDVLASTYFAAAQRHLVAWYEGEDIDPDSGLPHLVKAMASLAVLRDAQIQGRALDDRPPASPPGFMARLCETHAALQAKLKGKTDADAKPE
jgi:hypothetical protein